MAWTMIAVCWMALASVTRHTQAQTTPAASSRTAAATIAAIARRQEAIARRQEAPSAPSSSANCCEYIQIDGNQSYVNASGTGCVLFPDGAGKKEREKTVDCSECLPRMVSMVLMVLGAFFPLTAVSATVVHM